MNAQRGTPVSLEELIALNEEIISLTKAGVPLELGLNEVGTDQPGRLGQICQALGKRMSDGVSLSDALRAEGRHIPRVYYTVIEAGLRTGRLPSALEAITTFASELLELRRKIGFALLYPLIVIALAYGLFLVFIFQVAARMRDTYTLTDAAIPLPLWYLGKAGETAAYWAWIPPVVLLLIAVWWGLTSSSKILNPASPGIFLGWMPGIRSIAKNHQAANFADLLALMVQHEVPFNEGLVLAAEAAADPAFVASVREIANATARGESLTQLAKKRSAVPPFLRWVMAAHQQDSSLVDGLRLASTMYRGRANEQAAWLRLVFPVATAVIVGGGATLLYALTLFMPLTDMLRDLSIDVR